MTHEEFKALSKATGRSVKWLSINIGMCHTASWQRWCDERKKDGERFNFVYSAPADVVARLAAYIKLHEELLQTLPERVKHQRPLLVNE